jgi:enoyl-CoA hydratase/carnithine racemase
VITDFEDYRDKYPHIAMERRNGVLLIRYHTGGRALRWAATRNGPLHNSEEAFYNIARDPENRIVIITGTAEKWCTDVDMELHIAEGADPGGHPAAWERLQQADKAMLMNLLNIPVPVIAAVNGPATYHAELLVMSDIVICTDDTYFADDAHMPANVCPGDGVQVIWPMLLGPNRARYFQYMNQHIGAEEAYRLGIVGEVVSRENLLPRAWEIAEGLLTRSRLVLRYARTNQVEHIRRRVAEGLGYGLALEGFAERSKLDEAAR